MLAGDRTELASMLGWLEPVDISLGRLCDNSYQPCLHGRSGLRGISQRSGSHPKVCVPAKYQ